jgi:CheY-like chemotaxis protein
MIADVVSTIRPLIDQNQNQLIVECDESLGRMHSDLTKLRQNLFNLLSNATKFTKQGTVTLTVRRSPACPISNPNQLVDFDDWITFSVSDTGIGMTPEQLERLFQPFTQADASTTRKYGGTGLGLAITQRFCDMLGGGITVHSEVGKGSTFTMVLPTISCKTVIQEAVLEANLSLTKGAELPGDTKRVLVIDDDPTVHDLMQRFLTKEGFQVDSALSGKDGLQKAKAHRPDVITLDVMMPSQDGWSVLAALKADPDLADIPVIMLTMVDDKSMGYALGASDYLTKPIDRHRLSKVLKKYHCENPPCPILLVEDDPASRDMMRQILEKEGWIVTEAENGCLALDCLKKERPELILLDLMMPEMDGFGLVRELQRNPAWRSIPVIVVTAKDITPEDQRMLRGHVEQIFQKGEFSREELLVEIRQLVSGCV